MPMHSNESAPVPAFWQRQKEKYTGAETKKRTEARKTRRRRGGGCVGVGTRKLRCGLTGPRGCMRGLGEVAFLSCVNHLKKRPPRRSGSIYGMGCRSVGGPIVKLFPPLCPIVKKQDTHTKEGATRPKSSQGGRRLSFAFAAWTLRKKRRGPRPAHQMRRFCR